MADTTQHMFTKAHNAAGVTLMTPIGEDLGVITSVSLQMHTCCFTIVFMVLEKVKMDRGITKTLYTRCIITVNNDFL